MTTFTVDVTYTDRSRDDSGHYTTFWTRVDVLADSASEATLVAAQMVAAIRDDTVGGMVLATTILI